MKLGPLTLFEKKAIGSPLLLYRYILFRLPAIGVYLHQFVRSDYERALHDHPWPYVAIVLKNGYYEVHDQTISGKEICEFRAPGRVLVRPAEWRHRVQLQVRWWYQPGSSYYEVHSWSLVIVGRRQRQWGFHTPTGWCWWRQYNQSKDICEDHVLYEEGGD